MKEGAFIYCGSENTENIESSKGGNYYLCAVDDDMETTDYGLIVIVN